MGIFQNMECSTRLLVETWWIAAVAPLICIQLTRLLISQAQRVGLVDHPGGRKRHRAPTPLVGGLAIFLTIMVSALFLGRMPGASWSLFMALLVTLVIGLADDVHEVGHQAKFLAQIVAALIIVFGTSVQVTSLGDLLGYGPIILGKWSALVTVIAIVGLMNAVNMIDGLDGLAGTLVLLPLLLLSGIAFGSEHTLQTLEMLVIAGAIAGFLSFNLRTPWQSRAVIFMGDTGGMLLGLLLAWNSIQLAGYADAPIKPITVVWIIAMPLLDMGCVMMLRIWQGKSPFHADRQHLHHILQRGGYTCGQVVFIMSGLSLIGAIGALEAQRIGTPEYVMFYGFLLVLAIYLAALAKPKQTLQLISLWLPPKVVAPPRYGFQISAENE